MRLVIDVSVAVAWCATSQANDMTFAAAAHVASNGALVPSHFSLELANSVLQLKKRNRIDQERITGFIKVFLDFDVEIDHLPSHSVMLGLLDMAELHRLSLYDAAYLDLALRAGLPLATRDAALTAAARSAGAKLFQP